MKETNIEKIETDCVVLKSYCEKCGIDTKHLVKTCLHVEGAEKMNENAWYQYNNHYEIIQCDTCDMISFQMRLSNSEDNGYEGSDDFNIYLYPEINRNAWPAIDIWRTSFGLADIYNETINCFNNQNRILCAVGIRALIEKLCALNGVTKGPVKEKDKNGTETIRVKENIEGKINGLAENGILTKKVAKALHQHRFLGNAAAHELIAPSIEELTIALKIVEHVIETIYIIPLKEMELNERRTRSYKVWPEE